MPRREHGRSHAGTDPRMNGLPVATVAGRRLADVRIRPSVSGPLSPISDAWLPRRAPGRGGAFRRRCPSAPGHAADAHLPRGTSWVAHGARPRGRLYGPVRPQRAALSMDGPRPVPSRRVPLLDRWLGPQHSGTRVLRLVIGYMKVRYRLGTVDRQHRGLGLVIGSLAPKHPVGP